MVDTTQSMRKSIYRNIIRHGIHDPDKWIKDDEWNLFLSLTEDINLMCTSSIDFIKRNHMKWSKDLFTLQLSRELEKEREKGEYTIDLELVSEYITWDQLIFDLDVFIDRVKAINASIVINHYDYNENPSYFVDKFATSSIDRFIDMVLTIISEGTSEDRDTFMDNISSEWVEDNIESIMKEIPDDMDDAFLMIMEIIE